jgi:hypothetical protein
MVEDLFYVSICLGLIGILLGIAGILIRHNKNAKVKKTEREDVSHNYLTYIR